MFSGNKPVDCENFQDLKPWCDSPTMEEPLISHEYTMAREENKEGEMSTQYNHPCPWIYTEEVQSPSIASSSAANTPAISPAPQFRYNDSNMFNFEEQSYDIHSFITDLSPAGNCANSNDWNDIIETIKKDELSSSRTTPLLVDNSYVSDDEDFIWNNNSTKFQTAQQPISCDAMLTDYYMDKDGVLGKIYLEETDIGPIKKNSLHLDVNLNAQKPDINTPELLNVVEQLESEKQNVFNFIPEKKLAPVLQDVTHLQSGTSQPGRSYMEHWNTEYDLPPSLNDSICKNELSSESEGDDNLFVRQRDETDEEYTPHGPTKPKKYRKRKSSTVSKDDDAWTPFSQIKKARRGRPPKRRESYTTSAYNTDDNASTLSVEDQRYRELRNKNNEASKRSRMNRKMKEVQMEEIAVNLELENKRLKVRADVLEDMTKRLKEALMTAILCKK